MERLDNWAYQKLSDWHFRQGYHGVSRVVPSLRDLWTRVDALLKREHKCHDVTEAECIALLDEIEGGKPAAGLEWSEAKPPAQWRKELRISHKTLQRRVAKGLLIVDKVNGQSWRIRLDSLAKYKGK